MKSHLLFLTLAWGLFTLIGCQQSESGKIVLQAENLEKELQTLLISAKAGSHFVLPEGSHDFKRSLSLNDTPDITIAGAGKGKTILSFKGQIEGAEGLLIKNVKGLTLEGFTVADSKGDAIPNVVVRLESLRDLYVPFAAYLVRDSWRRLRFVHGMPLPVLRAPSRLHVLPTRQRPRHRS